MKGTLEYFVQTGLRRGNKRTVSWIPEKLAIVGQTIRLKEDDDTWSKPWLVIGHGDTRYDRKKMMLISHGWDKFKENTDI